MFLNNKILVKGTVSEFIIFHKNFKNIVNNNIIIIIIYIKQYYKTSINKHISKPNKDPNIKWYDYYWPIKRGELQIIKNF